MAFDLYMHAVICLYIDLLIYANAYIGARNSYNPTTHFGKKNWKKKNASTSKAKFPFFWQLLENYKNIFFAVTYFFTKAFGDFQKFSSTL